MMQTYNFCGRQSSLMPVILHYNGSL